MKKEIHVFNYSNEILKALQTGVLLTTQAEGKTNTMTITWRNRRGVYHRRLNIDQKISKNLRDSHPLR